MTDKSFEIEEISWHWKCPIEEENTKNPNTLLTHNSVDTAIIAWINSGKKCWVPNMLYL